MSTELPTDEEHVSVPERPATRTDIGTWSERFVIAGFGFMSVVKALQDDYVAAIYFLGWMSVFIWTRESPE